MMKNDVPIETGVTVLDDNNKGAAEECLIKTDADICPVDTTTEKHKKCCFVELNEGVSHFNLFTYYLVQFSYVCAFTFIDACQDYLLKNPDYYGIDPAEKGSVNGDILLFDTLYLVILNNFR
jgi:hypothetical protein